MIPVKFQQNHISVIVHGEIAIIPDPNPQSISTMVPSERNALVTFFVEHVPCRNNPRRSPWLTASSGY